MFRLFRGPVFLFCLALILRGLPAQAPNTSQTGIEAQHPQPEPAASAAHPHPSHPTLHGVPWRDATGPVGFAAPAGAHLTYFGGPVISNVHLVEVLYGSGAYL